MDAQEKRLRRAAPRRPEVPVGEELLVERSVGEPTPAPARSSLLQPQQDRNIIWRWHIRRRRPRR